MKTRNKILFTVALLVVVLASGVFGAMFNSVVFARWDPLGGLTSKKSPEVIDVSIQMEMPADSVYVDTEAVSAVRESLAYKEVMESLGNLGIYGTRCVSDYMFLNVRHLMFDVNNTDLIFVIELYSAEALADLGVKSDSALRDNGKYWSEYYVESLNAHVIAGEVSNTYNDKAAWIRFDTGVPTNSLKIYKAVALAGVEGKFSTDYDKEGLHAPVVNLYDLDTGDLLYSIKFSSEE